MVTVTAGLVRPVHTATARALTGTASTMVSEAMSSLPEFFTLMPKPTVSPTATLTVGWCWATAICGSGTTLSSTTSPTTSVRLCDAENCGDGGPPPGVLAWETAWLTTSCPLLKVGPG